MGASLGGCFRAFAHEEGRIMCKMQREFGKATARLNGLIGLV